LARARRTRYDRAAELWAVSVTLFEMATGVMPWWADGASAPASATDRPVIEPTSFDPAVGASLTELFFKALAPDVKERFGNVEDLLHAWSGVFASLALDADARQKDDELAAKVTLETALEQSGLSAHALSALRRLEGVVTVGDVLGVHPVKINRIRGLGESYRKEIQGRIAQWRSTLRPTEPPPGFEVALGVERVVENLLDMLPPADQPLARALVGLGAGAASPTATEIAASFQTTANGSAPCSTTAVAQWSKNKPFCTARGELTSILANAGRVMTVPDAVNALVTLRGSILNGVERMTYGTALVRAILELDARDPRPGFVLRRRAGAKVDLLALSEDAAASEDGDSLPSADFLTDVAVELGSTADDLVARGVVPASTAITKIRDVVEELDGGGHWQVSDMRLLRLAAAVSHTAAVSGFQELYPRALQVKEALDLAMRGKPGRSISQAAVQRTLSARFPHLDEPLPKGDRLDALVRELYPELVNRNGVYAPKSTALSSTGTVSTTQFAPTSAAEVTRKLTESLDRHSALTLTVAPKRYVAATKVLASTFDVHVLDLAGLVVSATREQIEKAGGMWHGLLGYDASIATASSGRHSRVSSNGRSNQSGQNA
jgi:hypothetical protein